MTLKDHLFKGFLFVALIVFSTSGILGAFSVLNATLATVYTATQVSLAFLVGCYINKTVTTK